MRFEFRDGEGPGFDGTMVTCDPPRVLEFFWGKDSLRFELEPTGEGTVLTLTDTFDELGKAARDGAGWHVCLDRFDFVLDGTSPRRQRRRAGSELNDMYVERFGPDAGDRPAGGPLRGRRLIVSL